MAETKSKFAEVSLSLFSGLTSLAGSIIDAEQTAAAQEFNASIARSQQIIIEASRKLERRREKKRARFFLSTQNALSAKSGVMLSGSPIDVIEDTAREFELDSIINDINASIRSSRLGSEVVQRKFRAKQARAGGLRRAGTTLLETAADVSKIIGKEKDEP